MQKGFTLIEVLAALMVFAIGVGGLFGLLGQTVVLSSNANSQLVANYLAQEGVEIARNIRDSNFLAIYNGGSSIPPWDNGLTGCASSTSGCGADYTSSQLAPNACLSLSFDTASGLYQCSLNSTYQFQRKIFVDGSGDARTITVQVTWQDKGRAHTVSGSTMLYNWLNPTQTP